jgi:hypothetical protein
VLAFPAAIHIQDFTLTTDLDSAYRNAVLTVDVEYAAARAALVASQDVSLHIQVSDLTAGKWSLRIRSASTHPLLELTGVP